MANFVWTAYSTGPDSEVLIGGEYKPYYKSDQGKDLGVSTWPPDHWKIGGGTVWGWISYDPELNLIYYGTGNPGSWNPDLRPGDNKFSAGIFARNPDTGQARWFVATALRGTEIALERAAGAAAAPETGTAPRGSHISG